MSSRYNEEQQQPRKQQPKSQQTTKPTNQQQQKQKPKPQVVKQQEDDNEDEEENIRDLLEPDWTKKCINCRQTPIVPMSGMCGPCHFGQASTMGGAWWDERGFLNID